MGIRGTKTWDDIQTWMAAAGSVSAGSYSSAGQWTFGPTTGSDLTHLFQSGGLTVVKVGTAANSALAFELNRTVNTASRWQAYLPGASTDLRFWNSVNSDVGIVTQGGSWTFGITTGTVGHIFNEAGANYVSGGGNGGVVIKGNGGRAILTLRGGPGSFQGIQFSNESGSQTGFSILNSSGNTVATTDDNGAWTFGLSTGSTNATNTIFGYNDSGYGNIIYNRSSNASSSGLQLRMGITTGSNTVLAYIDGSADVCGFVTMNATANTVAYTNSSDARLKHLFEDFNALDIVLSGAPKKYERICDPGVKEYGMVAQELVTILPQAVVAGTDDINPTEEGFIPWGIDYSKLTPILWKALQELKQEFDAYVLAHP